MDVKQPVDDLAKVVHQLTAECEQLRQRNDWLNEGVMLLMSIMSGRVIDRDSAEHRVYEDWRKKGTIVDPTSSCPDRLVGPYGVFGN